jgi:hypothetical protein
MRPIAVLAALLASSTALADPAPFQPMEISSYAIEHFQIGTTETRFGPLEFVGGISMTSPGRHFGALSSIAFATPGEDFVGTADTGFWFFGRVERDAQGRPSGIAGFRMQPIVDAEGKEIEGKFDSDAEGIDIVGSRVTASFERAHRVVEFELTGAGIGEPRRELDFLVPRNELRMNRGFETVASSPADGALAGARVVVSEKSIDPDGNIFAAVLEGPRRGVFKIARSGEFDVTDGAFLPGGDLLLLERKFAMATGVEMRLRRIPGDAIRPGAVVDGAVLFEANMAFQIDNMEGLEIWRRADGALMLSMVSDDNHSILQRNLYLEFRLLEE